MSALRSSPRNRSRAAPPFPLSAKVPKPTGTLAGKTRIILNFCRAFAEEKHARTPYRHPKRGGLPWPLLDLTCCILSKTNLHGQPNFRRKLGGIPASRRLCMDMQLFIHHFIVFCLFALILTVLRRNYALKYNFRSLKKLCEQLKIRSRRAFNAAVNCRSPARTAGGAAEGPRPQPSALLSSLGILHALVICRRILPMPPVRAIRKRPQKKRPQPKTSGAAAVLIRCCLSFLRRTRAVGGAAVRLRRAGAVGCFLQSGTRAVGCAGILRCA